jgi:toxin HigB-1
MAGDDRRKSVPKREHSAPFLRREGTSLSAGFGQRTQNKLKIVYAASKLDDLAVPPGNRLEALRGDRRGQWSIRVNDQWRICFVWDGTRTTSIEVVDYH